jgi:putative spermidine/putrescine transport system substrate-binding protein
MKLGKTKERRGYTKGKALFGVMSLMLVLLLVALACGSDPTPVPATSAPAPTAAPEPTATAVPGQVLVATKAPEPPTAVPAGPRPISEWTADEPATWEEIDAALEAHRGSSLNVTSWGGAYQAAQRAAYFIPFSEKFGIDIIEDSPVEYAKIRSMAETGNVTWDVVDSGTRAVYQLGPTGDLEELTPAIHNGYLLDGFPEVAITPWSGGGGILWSTGLAYNKNAIDTLWDGKKPGSWVDFWDVEGFPGRRGMGTRVNENIFFAQFAAHPEILSDTAAKLAIAKLTDAQVDESFEWLEKIKPDITVWWTGGTDCPQLLLSGELDMCTAWNGRIWNAQQEEGGDVLEYCYECGHLNQTDVFYIPLGSPNKELAELFIAWTAKPEINVEVSNYITYGPMTVQAMGLLSDHVPQEIIDALPTSPKALESVVIVDEVWLGTNLDWLAERMQGFLAGVE